jgi:hypothetical protein
MSILENKGWMAQDFYNEYLELKVKISELVKTKEHFERHRQPRKVIEEIEVELNEKVSRMRFVLEQFKYNGIALEDLILLSIGVDV